MKKYYIQKGNERKGPFELHELMAQKVYAETLVWTDSMDDWQPAEQIPELKPVLTQRSTRAGAASVNFDLSKYKWYLFGGGVILVAILILFSIKSGEKITGNNEPPAKTNVEAPKQENSLPNNNAENEASAQDAEMARKEKEEQNKRYIRNNWSNYFLCYRSGYTAEGLGGISGLKVYFENKTGYMVESASAEIDIYTASGSVYKTEYINFTNIKPYKSQTFYVPYSNRGSSVSNPRITYIKSALLNFCFSPYLTTGSDPNDPFRCQ